MIFDTPEYKQKLKEFDKITEYAVALGVFTDETKPLNERIVIMPLEEAEEKANKHEFVILVACFNEIMKVQILPEEDENEG